MAAQGLGVDISSDEVLKNMHAFGVVHGFSGEAIVLEDIRALEGIRTLEDIRALEGIRTLEGIRALDGDASKDRFRDEALINETLKVDVLLNTDGLESKMIKKEWRLVILDNDAGAQIGIDFRRSTCLTKDICAIKTILAAKGIAKNRIGHKDNAVVAQNIR